MDDQVDITEEDDEAAWKRRREGLRAFVDTIANHVQTMALPESYLEAERCVRSLTAGDRALQLLPVIEADLLNDKEAPAIKPIRRHIRAYADKVLDIVPRFPLPETFLEVERANRYALSADRMLAQLYGPAQMVQPKAANAKAGRRPYSVEDEAEDELEDEAAEISQAEAIAAIRTTVEAKIRGIPREKLVAAQTTGFWEDGTPYDPVRPHPAKPVKTDEGPGLRSLSP